MASLFHSPPMPAVARILSRYDRAKVEAFVEVAIGLLDTLDGNPDEEEEPLEDAFLKHDSTFADMDSDGRDAAWVEWQTMRGPQKSGHNLLAGHEDDEEDNHDEEADPSGQCDEDGINTGSGAFMMHGTSYHGPGCPISDDDCSYY